ncbi:MAG: class E sortase [Rubrobacteraceae bacterium]
MLGGFRTWILLASLTALGVLALPASFAPEPPKDVSTSLEVENTRALLGEETPAENGKQEGRAVSATRATGAMKLSVPRLGITDLRVPDGSTQEKLDREGIMRLRDSGSPGAKGSNTFIVGHALGYPSTRVRFVFRYLEKLRPGDEITLTKAGERYTFRVYDLLTVRPEDYWVTYPVTGKTIVSLQSCVPYPTFENRIVVRGELVS